MGGAGAAGDPDEPPRPAAPPSPSSHPQRDLLPHAQWLRVAVAAASVPATETVFHYFRTWRLDGTWQVVHPVLRELLRVRLGRDPQPSAGSIDSQSVKTTGVGGVRGYDVGKQVKGRKRHLLVDNLRTLLALDARWYDQCVPIPPGRGFTPSDWWGVRRQEDHDGTPHNYTPASRR